LDRALCECATAQTCANGVSFKLSLARFHPEICHGQQAWCGCRCDFPRCFKPWCKQHSNKPSSCSSAVNPYIPANSTYVIQQNVGNFSPQPVYNQGGSVATQPAPVTEPFRMLQAARSAPPATGGNNNKKDNTQQMIIIAIFAIIAILVIKMCL